MTWFDSKRLVAILLFFFGVIALVNTVIGAFIVPNTLIVGVLLLMFGRQMYQEATLDQIAPEEQITSELPPKAG